LDAAITASWEYAEKARKEAGLSQRELGEKIGLTDKAISAYEKKRATPTVQTLRDIGKVTYKPISYFINDGESEDIDIQLKIQVIEKELSAIRKILDKKKSE